MPYDSNAEIGHLIELNCIQVIKPKEILPGNDEEPFAKRTELGWGIIGKVGANRETSENDVTVHRTVYKSYHQRDEEHQLLRICKLN